MNVHLFLDYIEGVLRQIFKYPSKNPIHIKFKNLYIFNIYYYHCYSTYKAPCFFEIFKNVAFPAFPCFPCPRIKVERAGKKKEKKLA